MNGERLFELLSAGMDGELSDTEQAELDRLLEATPDASRLREELVRIDSILRKMPDLTLPEDLHGRIMTSISLPQAGKARPAVKRGSGWLGSLTAFSALRYGVAAAAGLVLAAAFYESRELSAPAELTELVGAMAPDRDRSASDVLDTYGFRAEGIKSEVSLERRNGMLLLDMRVDTERPVDIKVDLAAAGVRPKALAQTENPLELIEISGRTLRVRARGERQLTVLLERLDARLDDTGNQRQARIDLQFSSDGKLLQRGSLAAAW